MSEVDLAITAIALVAYGYLSPNKFFISFIIWIISCME